MRCSKNIDLKFIAPAALVLALVLPAVALGWGASGHRITARIAEDHLDAGTARAVAEVTGGHSLALLATWPDFIRSDSRWDCIQPWHFLTVEDGQAIDEALARPADTSGNCRRLYERFELPHNVVSAIEYFAAIVGGDKRKADNFDGFMKETGAEPYAGSTRSTALALLIHFIGDVHQPMHVGRGGDRGGNNVYTNFFDQVSRLHSVWDSGLIDQEGLSYTEFAAFLEQQFGDEQTPAESAPLDWAAESFGYRSRVYDIWRRTSRDNNLPELSYDYAFAQIGLIKQRLYHGGRRAAQLLNSIL